MSDYEQVLAAIAALTTLLGAALWRQLTNEALARAIASRRRFLGLAGGVLGATTFATAFIVASIAAPISTLNSAPGLTLLAAIVATLVGMAAMLPAAARRMHSVIIIGPGVVLICDAATLAAGGSGLIAGQPLVALAAAAAASAFGAAALDLAARGRNGREAFGAMIACLAIAASPIAAAMLTVSGKAAGLVDPFALVVACAGLAGVQAAWLAVRLCHDWLAAPSALERLAMLADGAEGGLALCRNGRVVAASRPFADLVDRDAEELAGRDIATLLFEPEGGGSLAITPEETKLASIWRRDGDFVEVRARFSGVDRQSGFFAVELRPAEPLAQAASSLDRSAAAARTLRRRIARSAASPVSAS